ncbi:hypothetical protein [Alterisphingorhabdus coralli]|uniref:Sulfotransferase n=1 Tax=Alterisphingorhabdus coralli TaxID=3071408 RepID=A0AA97F9D5_9SPHN|nr:hypothetical protein [Parasphingorhabdus sp. SCSIO 66989]WOE76556.1 hypothetical protein RB602_07540 [Parasphingorhabdus sp. SCSIO 66989]
MSQDLQTTFLSDPGFFPFNIDVTGERVHIARLSLDAIASASFLDQRVLQANTPQGWLEWQQLAEAGASLTRKPRFIFHIGHVGSTLMSRLLGTHDQVHALREPFALRPMAELGGKVAAPDMPWEPKLWQQRLQQLLLWLGRAPDEQNTIIKASSFVSEIAPEIMAATGPALLLTTKPHIYLATIFAGDAGRAETLSLAAARLNRLHRMLDATPWTLWQMSPGEKVAMSWACEMVALSRADSEDGDSLWCDFDVFLDAPHAKFEEIAAVFDLHFEDQALHETLNGPIMQQYSKAPEHGYSPQLRRDVIAQAEHNWAEEIAKGTAWLEAAAKEHPPIANALERLA